MNGCYPLTVHPIGNVLRDLLKIPKDVARTCPDILQDKSCKVLATDLDKACHDLSRVITCVPVRFKVRSLGKILLMDLDKACHDLSRVITCIP